MSGTPTYRKLDGSYVTLDEYLDSLEEALAELEDKVSVLEAVREKSQVRAALSADTEADR